MNIDYLYFSLMPTFHFLFFHSRMLEGWYFGEQNTPKAIKSKQADLPVDIPAFSLRGSLADKALNVQIVSDTNAVIERAARWKDKTDESIQAIETNIRYGMFCLTFKYFKALHHVRKEKAIWCGHHDMVSMWREPPMSDEKKKMIEEQKNFRFRRARIEYAMDRARKGEEKKRRKEERDRLEKVR